MRIDIISDTVCPWCFIGKRRLERALAAQPGLEVEIAWHPFQLNPDMPTDGMARATYLEMKFGGPERAKEIYRVVGEAGRSESLDFDFSGIRRTPNTLDSHRLVHFAGQRGNQDAVVEALFKAYFQEGRDIGDHEILADIAHESGLDRAEVLAYLAGNADVDMIRARDLQARTMGVSGVPCFIVDGRYAVSGAQDPEVFQQVFEVARQEREKAEAAG